MAKRRLIDLDEIKPIDFPSTEMDSLGVVRYLNTLPTVDFVQVVHGRWAGYHEADIGYDEYGVRCSNCNFEVEDNEVDFIMNYCPNCGAKMDGDGNG